MQITKNNDKKKEEGSDKDQIVDKKDEKIER